MPIDVMVMILVGALIVKLVIIVVILIMTVNTKIIASRVDLDNTLLREDITKIKMALAKLASIKSGGIPKLPDSEEGKHG